MTPHPSSAAHPLLACTDLSPASGMAVCRANQLAQAMQSPWAVLHVQGGSALDDLLGWLGMGTPQADKAALALVQAAERDVHAWLAATLPAQALASPRLTVQVSSGHVLTEVAAAVQQFSPSLLVVGARGEGDLLHMVVGSTAERLLRRTREPLLVVRQPVKGAYQRVLVPVDFSPWSVATLNTVRRLLPQAHLVLLHVWAIPLEGKLQRVGVDADTVAHYRQQARAQADQQLLALAQTQGLLPAQWSPCLVQGDASHTILAQAQQRSCDLIALGKHGRQVAEDLLLGSVTKHVLAESELDVLVCTLDRPLAHPLPAQAAEPLPDRAAAGPAGAPTPLH